MVKPQFKIILVFLLATIIRFWKLGNLPDGVSFKEVETAIGLSKTLGDFILNPFYIRIPSFLLSLLSLFFTYKFTLYITKNQHLSVLMLLLVSISPWHIQESRIFSYSIFLLLLFFLFFYFAVKVTGKNLKKVLLVTILIYIFTFGASLFKKSEEIQSEVSMRRDSIPQTNILLRRIIINRVTVTLEEKVKTTYETLDFGNYFFKGHPRERWGTEESQKLFIAFIPLLIYGLIRGKGDILYLTLSWFMAYFSVKNLWNVPELPLIYPLTLLVSHGLVTFMKKITLRKKVILAFLFVLTFYEFVNFSLEYNSGKFGSQFSPRRPAYKKAAEIIKGSYEEGDKISISPKLSEVKSFLIFYNGKKIAEDIFIEDNTLGDFSDDRHFVVGRLPYEPSPSEPLYFLTKDNVPTNINVIGRVEDDILRQTLYIFKSR